MTDFGYLNKIEVRDQTAEYIISEIEVNGKSPTLVLTPTTQANQAYFNAVLKSSTKKARRTAGSGIDASILSEGRDEDRTLFAKHVVKGWSNVVDAKTGKPVPFNAAECQAFLEALPDWKFDDIRNFCGNARNFLDTSVIEIGDEEEAAGN